MTIGRIEPESEQSTRKKSKDKKKDFRNRRENISRQAETKQGSRGQEILYLTVDAIWLKNSGLWAKVRNSRPPTPKVLMRRDLPRAIQAIRRTPEQSRETDALLIGESKDPAVAGKLQVGRNTHSQRKYGQKLGASEKRVERSPRTLG